MKTIYRYEINDASGINKIELPNGANVISSGLAHGGTEAVSIWAEVDTEEPPVQRTFAVVGTGADLDWLGTYEHKYIGTVQKANKYAFHIYEIYGDY